MVILNKKVAVHSSNINQFDVLLGRGAFCAFHTGSIAFKALVVSRLSSYVKPESRKVKTLLTLEIISSIQRNGGRFLVKNEDTKAQSAASKHSYWYEIGRSEARIKVRDVFRDCIKSIQKLGLPSVLLEKVGMSGLFGGNSTFNEIAKHVQKSTNVSEFACARYDQTEDWKQHRSSKISPESEHASSSRTSSCPGAAICASPYTSEQTRAVNVQHSDVVLSTSSPCPSLSSPSASEKTDTRFLPPINAPQHLSLRTTSSPTPIARHEFSISAIRNRINSASALQKEEFGEVGPSRMSLVQSQVLALTANGNNLTKRQPIVRVSSSTRLSSYAPSSPITEPLVSYSSDRSNVSLGSSLLQQNLLTSNIDENKNYFGDDHQERCRVALHHDFEPTAINDDNNVPFATSSFSSTDFRDRSYIPDHGNDFANNDVLSEAILLSGEGDDSLLDYCCSRISILRTTREYGESESDRLFFDDDRNSDINKLHNELLGDDSDY